MAQPANPPSLQGIDLTPGPDLHPIYPHASVVAPLLAPSSGLSPTQRQELVAHSVTRACVFGDIQNLTYLLNDPVAQAHLDLAARDEDGLGLLSLTMLGFGDSGNPDREVEREECVRLLVQEGVDPNAPDNHGWTALHHAALLSPPTLVSYLLTHGCSPLSKTNRGFTALDIVAGYSRVPGRDDVALLLEESMREEGWTGTSRRELQRKALEEHLRRRQVRSEVMARVGRVLDLGDRWYTDGNDEDVTNDEDDADDMSIDDPAPHDFAAMLVFSPSSLPYILHSLITTQKPVLRSSEPAKALHMLARFACISTVIVGAVDKIEEVVYNQPDDVASLAFWLCNTTTILHLLRTDPDVAETCDILGLFVLLEELLNAIYVFIIRIAERRIDPLLDTCVLDYVPSDSDVHTVQFESDWKFFRSLRKKQAAPNPNPPSSTSRPSSPVPQSASAASMPMPPEPAPAGSPAELTRVLHALHTLLIVAGVNPAVLAQAHAQILYWAGCELFNRLLTRKKYLCRSRARVIAANLAAVEAWMLLWLRVQSSVGQFDVLIATMQDLRHLNPLQMRRAVRDYRYEVDESKMTEECTQYLAQMQKDWERHRVQAGVEKIRKEQRELDDSGSHSSFHSGGGDAGSMHAPMPSSSESMASEGAPQHPAQQGIDQLFDRGYAQAEWAPPKPAEALGELLDSRAMLPLILPSDARLLAAVGPRSSVDGTGTAAGAEKAVNGHGPAAGTLRSTTKNASDGSGVGGGSGSGDGDAMRWQSRVKSVRDVGVELLETVDGVYSLLRRVKPVHEEHEQEHDEEDGDGEQQSEDHEVDTQLHSPDGSPTTPSLSPQFTVNPKRLKPGEHRRAGRASTGGEDEEPDVGVAL
ncbi:hypothetical protein BKA62DRAFT_821886 [Auriculariales sp. MPI-PUGE-AT-0066]|nr:hypothetical protein BKA62DRAFT_821886 [Auriculariales sp. MPI-PUGE-AT-0066]